MQDFIMKNLKAVVTFAMMWVVQVAATVGWLPPISAEVQAWVIATVVSGVGALLVWWFRNKV